MGDELTDGEPLKGFAAQQAKNDELMNGSTGTGMPLTRQERMLADRMRHERKMRIDDEDVACEAIYQEALHQHRLEHPLPEIIPPEFEAMIEPDNYRKKKKKKKEKQKTEKELE